MTCLASAPHHTGTDYYPSSASQSETLIVMFLVIIGALLWTRVLATFCDVATNSRPGLTYFHQQLDGLNEFIFTNRLPKEMGYGRVIRPPLSSRLLTRVPSRLPSRLPIHHSHSHPRSLFRQRLREYLHQMKRATLQEHAAKTIPNLSIALQIEVSSNFASHTSTLALH